MYREWPTALAAARILNYIRPFIENGQNTQTSRSLYNYFENLKKNKNKIRPKVLHSIQAHCETIIYHSLFLYAPAFSRIFFFDFLIW